MMRCLLLLLPLLSPAMAVRAQVKYLGGITFLLRDRCPEGASQADVATYEECVTSQNLHTQCETDLLKDGSKLTVPFYTDICSAICYTQGQTRRVSDCPFNGIRLDGRGGGRGNAEVNKPLADRFLG